jgi:hypothetical protein
MSILINDDINLVKFNSIVDSQISSAAICDRPIMVAGILNRVIILDATIKENSLPMLEILLGKDIKFKDKIDFYDLIMFILPN